MKKVVLLVIIGLFLFLGIFLIGLILAPNVFKIIFKIFFTIFGWGIIISAILAYSYVYKLVNYAREHYPKKSKKYNLQSGSTYLISWYAFIYWDLLFSGKLAFDDTLKNYISFAKKSFMAFFIFCGLALVITLMFVFIVLA